MSIAIIQIRRAAQALRDLGEEQISDIKIGVVLHQDPSVVRSYLARFDGLAHEMGIIISGEHNEESIDSRYRAAVLALRSANRPITRKHIAQQSGDSFEQVRAFFNRHESYLAEWKVLGAREAFREEFRMDLMRIADELHGAKKKVTLKDIADTLAINYSALLNRFSVDPSLRTIIKPYLSRRPRGPALHQNP